MRCPEATTSRPMEVAPAAAFAAHCCVDGSLAVGEGPGVKRRRVLCLILKKVTNWAAIVVVPTLLTDDAA